MEMQIRLNLLFLVVTLVGFRYAVACLERTNAGKEANKKLNASWLATGNSECRSFFFFLRSSFNSSIDWVNEIVFNLIHMLSIGSCFILYIYLPSLHYHIQFIYCAKSSNIRKNGRRKLKTSNNRMVGKRKKCGVVDSQWIRVYANGNREPWFAAETRTSMKIKRKSCRKK